MSRKHPLAELQLAIMQTLWERGEATVAEVREALERERPLGPYDDFHHADEDGGKGACSTP